MALYSLALTMGLVLAAPWWLWRMATTARYREGLRERLGAVPRALREAVRGRRVVWVHAVSVGEVLAATRLVAELEAALGDGWVVAVSTTTRTGQALARERFGAGRVFYMPLDFAFAVRAYMRVLQPAVLVLMESELWPRLLHEAGCRDVPVVVANARVSDRSFARAMKFRAMWSRMLRGVTMFLAQSEEDARRLRAMGAADVRAIGNLKYDIHAARESWACALILKAANGRGVFVAGSTVDADGVYEDEFVRQSWAKLADMGIATLLVLAPRHPENFAATTTRAFRHRTLNASDLKVGVRSEEAVTESGLGDDGLPVEIVVLDTIGDLAAVYGIADVAFVGGSLVKGGGHNPLEPAQFGVPVIMGPSYENFREIVTTMLTHEGIVVLGQNAGISPLRPAASGRDDSVRLGEELAEELMRLLTDRNAAKAMGERGRQVFEAQQGATARAVDVIVAVVKR